MKRLKFILFLVTSFFFLGRAQAQIAPQPLIAPELLRADFQIFCDSMRRLHAGLYTYHNKNQIDRLFSDCNDKLNEPMTLISFYCIIRHAVSGIEDGHTSAFLPPQVNQDIIQKSKFFPLLLYFIGSKAYTTCDSEGLPAGAEITAVDGRAINSLRKEMFSYIPSDGSTQTGKYTEMNDGDSPFFYLYRLLYGERQSFKIAYVGVDGQHFSITVNAKLFKDIPCHPQPVPVKRYLDLRYPAEGTATMTIKSFFNQKLKSTNEDLSRFLQDSFQAIAEKHIKKLIIDVRDNTGGNDENGAKLMGYLADHPFAYYRSIETTTRVFEVKDHDQLGLQPIREPHFLGPVFVLINGKCFSGTTDFAGVACGLPNVKFIGEETGGGYFGNTSGARSTLILFNTAIKVNVPLWKYLAAVKHSKYKDRGIIPDYSVAPTIQDILKHRDVPMAFALKLAAETKVFW